MHVIVPITVAGYFLNSYFLGYVQLSPQEVSVTDIGEAILDQITCGCAVCGG